MKNFYDIAAIRDSLTYAIQLDVEAFNSTTYCDIYINSHQIHSGKIIGATSFKYNVLLTNQLFVKILIHDIPFSPELAIHAITFDTVPLNLAYTAIETTRRFNQAHNHSQTFITAAGAWVFKTSPDMSIATCHRLSKDIGWIA